MNLGDRIRAWRKAKGLTQQELADACGVTVSAVSLWEAGETAPSHPHLSQVADRLGLTMERFYGRVRRAS